MLIGIVEDVFGTTAEDRHGGMCSENLGLRFRAYDLQKIVGYSPWSSLCSHPKCGVPWSFKSHELIAFDNWLLKRKEYTGADLFKDFRLTL